MEGQDPQHGPTPADNAPPTRSNKTIPPHNTCSQAHTCIMNWTHGAAARMRQQWHAAHVRAQTAVWKLLDVPVVTEQCTGMSE